MRRVFLLFLLALLLPNKALSFYFVDVDGITYYLGDNKEAYVNNGGSCSGDIVILSSINYGDITYSVTSIGSHAFENCSSITSVAIPNSVTSIGFRASLVVAVLPQ